MLCSKGLCYILVIVRKCLPFADRKSRHHMMTSDNVYQNYMLVIWVHRRAQQKCRERQKQKLKLSESRAQELQKALEALKLEKSVLVAHNELLQRMVGLHGNSPQPLQPPPHIDEAYSQVHSSSLRNTLCETCDMLHAYMFSPLITVVSTGIGLQM